MIPERCRGFLTACPGPLLVPTTVFTEVCLVAEARRGTRAERAFLADVRAGLFTLVQLLAQDLDRIAELIGTYESLPSAVLAGTLNGIARSYSPDRDAYRVELSLERSDLHCVVVDPGDPDLVFAGTWDDGVLPQQRRR